MHWMSVQHFESKQLFYCILRGGKKAYAKMLKLLNVLSSGQVAERNYLGASLFIAKINKSIIHAMAIN